MSLRLLAAALAIASAACAGAGGIHARMAYSEESGLRVVDLPPGPALDAGVQLGDRIVAIDGEPVHGLSLVEIVERLRGRTGSTVRLDIAREGEIETVDIERARYEE